MLAVNKIFIRSQLIFDLILIVIGFVISASVAQSFQLFFENYLLIFLLVLLLVVWYFSAKITGVYDNITLSPFLRFTAIIKNIFIQGFVEIVFIFISKELLFTRNFVLFYIVLLIVLIPAKSFLVTKFFRVRKEKGNNFNKLLIVGTGELGHNFFKQFSSYPNLDYKIVGFVDKTKDPIADELYLGSFEMLDEIIRREGIDDVVLALDVTELQNYSRIIRICNNAAVRVHILPDYFQFMTKNLSLSAFDDFPIITLRTILLDQFHWKFIKRVFDLAFSLLVLLFIGSWLFLIIAIVQKLTSRGRYSIYRIE